MEEVKVFKHSVEFIENIIQVQDVLFFPYDLFPCTYGLTYFL